MQSPAAPTIRPLYHRPLSWMSEIFQIFRSNGLLPSLLYGPFYFTTMICFDDAPLFARNDTWPDVLELRAMSGMKLALTVVDSIDNLIFRRCLGSFI